MIAREVAILDKNNKNEHEDPQRTGQAHQGVCNFAGGGKNGSFTVGNAPLECTVRQLHSRFTFASEREGLLRT